MRDLDPRELQKLLNLVANGHDQGVKELYMHYSTAVRDFIRSQVHDDFAVSEILNDSFLVMCRKPRDFNGTSRFSTWLCGIANNKIKDWQRQQGRQLSRQADDDFELDQVVDPNWNLLDQMEENEKHYFLKECLKALPPKQREVLRMIFDLELPLAEIAQLMDVPLGTAKTRAMHARLKIAECVQAHYKNTGAL